MKLRFKLALLSMSAGFIAFQLGGCGRFWGDVVADLLIFRSPTLD